MPFNPDTGEWSDGFDNGSGKQSAPSASVPAIEAPSQIDTMGGITPMQGSGTRSDALVPPPVNSVEDTTGAPPPTTTSAAPTSDPATAATDPYAASAAPSYQPQAAAAAPAPASGDLNGLTRQRIMDLLNTPQNLSADAVASSPEMTAARIQNEKGTRTARAQAAEQAAQGGYSSSGGENGIQRGITEQEGTNNAVSAGNIASSLRQQQIAQLTQGIQFALNSGQFDQANALQLKLAQMNQDTAGNQIGYNYTALQEQANRDAVLAALAGIQ